MDITTFARTGVLLAGMGYALGTSAAMTDDPAAATARAAEARFKALDVNHDGVLSRYEYDSEVVFEVADTDHNGLLSAQELEAALPPPAPGTPSAARRMLVADLDHDGNLNDDELRHAVEQRFTWLDRDHDGNLELDEMQAGYGVRVRP